ncbi:MULTISPECIES: glucose-6-phosphate isomerase [Campylobacter]|uniref:glucose-6-phosphate isomerase n=1 Tax=Campylobacter TaxID=194 RepID=UPI000A339782|nr:MULTISPECIES: glucose-6-phosphate isomerase [Campylobacter]MBE6429399.1 glucose-6-phosphate isomerase [Campylobacter sp.]MBQ3166780.1 glucose-6-phosphate isomerase [Campylobacter sp.]MDL0104710.1 glucose-6-phosphate isomerase [Campylobacter ovis]MDL0106112.1 glucose-6-phosphate isomerase [Campylobacter ovis]
MVKNNLKFNRQNISSISSYTRRMNDEIKGDDIGYYHLPSLGMDIVSKIEEIAKRDFDSVVLVGVGGSSLGVKALYDMLNLQKELIFLDNLDPYSIEQNSTKINPNRSIFIISSKSGTTIETISIYKYILEKFNIKSYENFIFITDPNSPLESYAKEIGAIIFNIPKNVGGRFSVLSAIGLVPLGLCGADIKDLLAGANSAKEQYLDNGDDGVLQKAYHYATHSSAKINVLFSYSDRLTSFNEWYVQLWAESLGKKRGYKRVGLTPVGLVGSKDQHSFLQLIMEGVKDKTVTFITIKDHNSTISVPNLKLNFLDGCDFVNSKSIAEVFNAQAHSTMQALASEMISIDELVIDRLDEWHCGWLIYYYELLTSATGLMLGINTYDQPGVEAGKRILKKLLESKES